MTAHSARRWLVVAAVVVTVLGVAAGPGTAAPTRVSSTKQWDPRIAPIAKKVEELRDLKFEHPVPVRYLSDADFAKRQRADRSKLSADAEQDLERSQAQLRALGLISADTDLFDAGNDIRSSDVLAYYDPETKRITVKGNGPLDAPVKVVLAHELTHALQDQHFDLKRIDRVGARHHASTATSALVEGDAVRIQNLYQQDLSTADQDAVTEEQSQGASSAAQNAPDMLLAIFQAPYTLGPAMVQAAAERAGGIDGLFRTPPTTDAAYLTPSTLLDGVHVSQVPRPGVTGTEKAVGKPDVFGAFVLYLVLGSQLGPQTALRVADGWGGDSMISFERDGHTCLRAAFVGRDAKATTAIRESLADWAQAMSTGAATVAPRTDRAVLSVCDIGEAHAPIHGADELIAFAEVRDSVYAGLVGQGRKSLVATCTADRFVRDPQVSPLLAAPNDAPDPAVLSTLRSRAQEILQACS